MSIFRCVALGSGLALVAVLFAGGQAEGQVRRQNQQIQIIPGRGADGPLVSKEAQEKLNLTAEQKEKIEKIEKEFADKNKDSQEKIREAAQKARQDQDRTALQKVMETVQKQRGEFEDKVKAVLNDEQKKKFEEAKATGRRPGVIQPGQVRPIGRAGDQSLQSRDVQEKLNLTAEQKTKLEQLQKELEAKSLQVLTEQQKKQFEELKKQPARPSIRRPGTDR